MRRQTGSSTWERPVKRREVRCAQLVGKGIPDMPLRQVSRVRGAVLEGFGDRNFRGIMSRGSAPAAWERLVRIGEGIDKQEGAVNTGSARNRTPISQRMWLDQFLGNDVRRFAVHLVSSSRSLRRPRGSARRQFFSRSHAE